MTTTGSKLDVALALDLSVQHISQLIEMLDVNGCCQGTSCGAFSCKYEGGEGWR